MQNTLLFRFFAFIPPVLLLLALVLVSPGSSSYICLAYSSAFSFCPSWQFQAELFAANQLGTTQKAHKPLFQLHVGSPTHPRSRHSRSSSPGDMRINVLCPQNTIFHRFLLPKERTKTFSFIQKASQSVCHTRWGPHRHIQEPCATAHISSGTHVEPRNTYCQNFTNVFRASCRVSCDPINRTQGQSRPLVSSPLPSNDAPKTTTCKKEQRKSTAFTQPYLLFLVCNMILLRPVGNPHETQKANNNCDKSRATCPSRFLEADLKSTWHFPHCLQSLQGV